MIATFDIPHGYKSSPLGIIPKDWEVLEFGQIADIAGKKYTPSQTEHVPCIELEHMVAQDGGIYGYTDSANQESTKNVFEVGNVLFGKLRPYLRKFWLATFNGVCSSEIWVFKNKKCSSKYLYDLLQSDRFLQNANVSFGSKMPRADWNYLQHTLFPLPLLAEQERIAELLGTWDKAIEMQKQLIDKLELRKKGLMQQLLTGKKRLPGFTGEWKKVRLGEVFDKIVVKNRENNKNVLTISAQYGLINQLDFFNKSVSATDVTGYYLLHKGDFAYNKSRSQGKPVGAIKPLKLYEKGVVSTLYICFRCKEHCQNDFWEQYFDAGVLEKDIIAIAQEGARNHGLLNISTNDFFELPLIVPTTTEQQKIADYLSSFDYEIQKMTEKLNKYIEEKQGLMQVLLTGKKRISLS